MLPAHGEEFHASWARKGRPDDHELWHSDIPLIVRDVSVGRLKITGVCSSDSVCTWMSDLIAGLKPFEAQMLELINECISVTASRRSRTSSDVLHPLNAPITYEIREVTS
jgi:hypothetical protein